MSYNHETIAEKNIALSFEFERYVQEHPNLLEQIPNNAEIVLLPKDDPELYRLNLAAAQQASNAGNIIYVEVEAVAPARSRLVNPRLTTQPSPDSIVV
ncbi:MAG: hypothetical protein JW850_07840 [Thermoflexales bacterium]|nr:hypothetical protein [Thermoflexales bacterium]